MKYRILVLSLLLSVSLGPHTQMMNSADFSSEAPPQKPKKPRVVVIDTGVNSSLYPEFFSENCLYSNRSGFDEHGHGTHVISLILDQAPEAEIISLKYFSPEHSESENLVSFLKCLERAQDFSPDIINISGGGPEFSLIEQKLIQDISRSQALLIMAAGNFSQSLDLKAFYPASYSSSQSLVIGSLDIQGQKLPSSNYSTSQVHGAFLGQNVRALTGPKTWTEMTGTSQATALISGLAARLWLEQEQLRSPQKLKEHLEKTALRKESLKDYFSLGRKFETDRALRMRENPETFKLEDNQRLSFSDL